MSNTKSGKLIALGIGVAIALVIAEGALRAMGIVSPVFHRPDARYGLALIPGAEGWFVSEGRSWVAINADGMRDVAHRRARPPDTFRIAVIGDSYAEALQVPHDQTFLAVLGNRLAGCAAIAGRQVEVLNFGVSGYSTAQEYLVLQDRVWAFEPHVVVLAFLTGNDVADNSPALSAAPMPFFRFDGGDLVLDHSRVRPPGAGRRALLGLVRHSRVLQLAKMLRQNLALCGTLRACGADPDIAKGELGLRNGIYLEPTEDAWRDAWRVTEALLVKIRDQVVDHHAKFFLVSLTNGIQVNPDLAVRENFRRAIGAADLLYPDRRVAAFAKREGIAVLSLAPELAARAVHDRAFFHGWNGPDLGKGHWNAAGHRIAGETIAPWLCEGL